MTELTGKEAKTIHRPLEVEWDEHDRPTFKRNIRNPLECEALILDAVSYTHLWGTNIKVPPQEGNRRLL